MESLAYFEQMIVEANRQKIKLHSFDLSSLDFSDEVKTHIELMLSAVTSVSKEYLWYKVTSDDEEVEREQLERVFAYEFYYQWRRLLESFGCTLILNGEVSKKVRDKISVKRQYAIKYPDMVLHAGQDNFDEEFQLIVCEIKRKEGFEEETFRKDLSSIISYLDKDNFNKAPFQCGVLLLVGDTLDDSKIKSTIKTVARENHKRQDCYKNILCVSYNYIRESKKFDLTFSILENLISGN